ncbi:hypothetical protein POV27_12270 [Aureisphaera galaxeae]|uniref:hypothetical protein n=1 Tax=Aureisphaera galaxeae TaxID=1538023 RepID=UPI0023505B2E|nr:hypothetical protein [Aureisphaera galaxeae]MDC8004830.1 hypothetical protein [Aureisphaera galaxeae]
MEKITLYEFESPSIKISMEIYFNENNQLIFDGYDIGETVKDLMGDSDYEYYYTIEFEEVKKIAALLGADINDKMAILLAIEKHFNGNDAYSKFGNFMKKNNIIYEQFTWI